MRLAFYYHATTVEQKITNLLPNHKTILPVKPGANRCNWTWTPDVSMTGIFFYHRTVAAGRMFTNLLPNQMSLFLSFFTQAIGGSWTQNPGIELTRLAFYRQAKWLQTFFSTITLFQPMSTDARGGCIRNLKLRITSRLLWQENYHPWPAQNFTHLTQTLMFYKGSLGWTATLVRI